MATPELPRSAVLDHLGVEIEDPEWWTRRGLVRPDWWVDELDEASALARHNVRTPKQAQRLLWKHRNPERVKVQREAHAARRRKTDAPKKIAEHTAALVTMREELQRLESIVVNGIEGALKADGTPYEWCWDASDDRDTLERRIKVKEKALNKWQQFVRAQRGT